MIKAWAGNGRFDFVFWSCSASHFPPVIDEKLKRLRLHWSLVWFNDQIWFHITCRPQSFQAHLSYFRFHTWGHWVLLVCGFPPIEMRSKIKVLEPDMPDRVFKVLLFYTLRKHLKMFGKEKSIFYIQGSVNRSDFLSGKIPFGCRDGNCPKPLVTLFAFLGNVEMFWSNWPSAQHLDWNHHCLQASFLLKSLNL